MKPLRLGIIPLSDCAVLAVAKEKGFFRRHGVEVTLSREVSWANVRDKVAAGALDGAQMLAGMPLAASVGIDPLARPLITALSLDLNGNAVTVSTDLWKRMVRADPEATTKRPIGAGALKKVIEEDRRSGRPLLRFAVVYPFASHNYELRYWLAAAGIDPENDVRLVVVPPPRMVEYLEREAIDGFCVGEPWSSLAVQHDLGRIVVTKYEIWNNSPEKVFAVSPAFAEERAEEHRALLRALLEAAAWTDAAENRAEVARLLADERYVGAAEPLLRASLSGRLLASPDEAPLELPDFHVFHRYAASFPWISHAAWLLLQMIRWGQMTEPIDVLATARSVYRPDLHREAARDIGLAAPATDVKTEGAHAGAWSLADGDGGTIAMGADLFIDGRPFDPAKTVEYLAESAVSDLRVSLDALAARNG
ncbi:MAG: ABC transporter substrate-binding protein [Deltaproteobacteria bacterium]|nr:ABC transporter substrate-binding protein [Deltaproteobacteria bacterium]